MKSYIQALLLAGVAAITAVDTHAERNPQAIKDLLDRIGGKGASAMIETEVDASMAVNGKETFSISSAAGKPQIKGSSLSALTTGINWYLNHTAGENLSWNRLTTTFSTLPAPTGSETHTSSADYRYYLNYCTFSYSMSTWTWERWEQEIDYMALHGINMPLQIVGLDVVWRNLLTKDFGYSADEADAFIAGPCFQAWWGMNNLEGWGGKNPDWWYERQEQLAKKILARMRELGIEPVLPGFSGMVPHDFTAKTGLSAITQGGWCGFTRPYILNPETDAFRQVADKYYARLAELMGTSQYYSMDPFHEGANTSGISNIGNAYKAIYEAMDCARAGSQWVIQQWQWSNQQYSVLDNVPKGRLIVLDLFSDGKPNLGAYRGHDVIYCSLPNFGGRTGLFGRFNGIINGYFDKKATIPAIKGVGATPEGIEQAPVLYDMLFELPWHSIKPDPAAAMAEYAKARYGVADSHAAEAWELLRNSALNCTSALQGPHEAVMCARPAWTVKSVSTWGGSDIFYNPDHVAAAAYALLEAPLSGENYSYDLTDVTRQALTDYSYYLLRAINESRTGDRQAFDDRKATFLALISDLDGLLATNRNFMLGRWTCMARGIADEAEGTTEADRQWLELNNARTLISTWGERNNAEGGGLRDYSYRQWSGMLKDYYRPRWEKFFAGQNVDWYGYDHAWAINKSLSYSDSPIGDTKEKAGELLRRYLPRMGSHFIYRSMANDLSSEPAIVVYRGETFTLPIDGEDVQGYLVSAGTISGIGSFTIPADAPMGDFDASAVNGSTVVKFRLSVRDRISAPRTISVISSDPTRGSASVGDTGKTSVTTSEPEVSVIATPAPGFQFSHWSIGSQKVSADNPYIYYGANDITITANFTDAPLLSAGDVMLRYSTLTDGSLIVTSVDSGAGHANLAEASTQEAPIVAIAPGAFTGNEDITAVTLPASCVSLNGVTLATSLTGEGKENVIIKPEKSLAKDSSWALTMKVHNSGTTFNQWGSGLLSTGSNSLAATYSGGFQLYLNTAGRIVVKTGSNENTGLSATVGTRFTLTAIYDAPSRRLSVILTNASGTTKTISVNNYTLNEVTEFASSIPAGVNIESLIVFTTENSARPFAGCTALTDFAVEAGNHIFSAKDGKLLSTDGKTLTAYPEGRLFTRAFRLINGSKALYAEPSAGADGEMIDRDRQILVSAERTASPSSLLRLTKGTENYKVEHLNSHRFFGKKESGHDRIELPVSASQNGEYSYSWTASDTDCMLTLNLPVSGLYVSADGTLKSTDTSFKIDDTAEISLTDEISVVALPINVKAPAGAYTIHGIDNDLLLTTPIAIGSVIPAGTGFLVIGKSTLAPAYDGIPNQQTNYLTGTLLNRTGMTEGNFFIYDPATRTFIRSTSTSVAANSAFIPASAFGNPIAAEILKIDVIEKMTDIQSASVSSDCDIIYYDITGRPATRGLLIGTDGSKSIH